MLSESKFDFFRNFSVGGCIGIATAKTIFDFADGSIFLGTLNSVFVIAAIWTYLISETSGERVQR